MFKKVTIALYGLLCYGVGMAALGYSAFWLIDLTPNALDGPGSDQIGLAILIDTALIALFALQHSGMARPTFKRVWTRIIPAASERSTYLLCTGLIMGLWFYAWQPIGLELWRIDSGPAYTAILALYAAGWCVLVSATFFINHFDLMGLRQVWLNLRGLPYQDLPFMVRGLYGVVRHPIYLGWFMVIWFAPVMTVAHLLFAVLTTLYIIRAIRWEEKDLLEALPEYDAYRQRVPSIIPGRKQTTTQLV